jgi:hypothetical protein
MPNRVYVVGVGMTKFKKPGRREHMREYSSTAEHPRRHFGLAARAKMVLPGDDIETRVWRTGSSAVSLALRSRPLVARIWCSPTAWPKSQTDEAD